MPARCDGKMKKIYGWNYYCENILRENETYIKNSLEKKEESYLAFEMRDRGKVRELHQVDKSSGLYQLQNNLNKNLLSRIPLSKAAMGFVKRKSYQEYLRPHCGKRFHLRLDIRHFFDSVTEEQVVKSLEEFVQDEEIRINIGQITTLGDCLPQGAVTSPAMSNIVFRRIDQRILKYCQTIRKVKVERNVEYDDIIYTRYADDMLFSSDYLDFRKMLSFYKMIKHILLENGFHLNHDKTYMTEGEISLSGFVAGGKEHGCVVRLSRKRMSEINRVLNYFDKRGVMDGSPYQVDTKKVKDPQVVDKINALFSMEQFVQFNNKKSVINYLCGYRAFLITFLKAGNEQVPQLRALKRKIGNLEKLIDQCQEQWFGFE